MKTFKQIPLLIIASLCVGINAHSTGLSKEWALSAQTKTALIASSLSSAPLSTNVLFRKGALYEISGIKMEYPGQLVTVSELSGSWRLIDPFRHRALRMGSNGLEWGEENGSDELQKWTITPTGKKDEYEITATNVGGNKGRTGKHIIRESASFGSDDGCTYQFVSVVDDRVLGDGDDGGNNVRIRAEKRDSLNRGQYWNIKTLSSSRHIISGAFYQTNFDDGGNNARIDYLLQWPAQDGNWGNALMSIQPVEGQNGIYRIVSANKNKMFTLKGGEMKIADINENDRNSWFVIREVEKPKIQSPIWEDETVFNINRLEPVAWYVPYTSEREMLGDKEHYQKPWAQINSSLVISLDGVWNFNFVSSPEQRPDGQALSETSKGHDRSVLTDTVSVPGCWEMQGYDRPIYCNVEYPHSNTPPYIKARPGYNDGGKNYGINPVGTYQRTFTVPQRWLNQRTILHFGGIHSAAFIYLNGKMVGYTQGQSNVDEFDISPYLINGENNLVVQVLRWCDGSYLECQDMFRMSGITRSVYLFSLPAHSIRDHQITTDLNGNYDYAVVKVKMKAENTDKSSRNDLKVKVRLFDPQDNEISTAIANKDNDSIYSASFNISDPILWTAETPSLYTLRIIQQDANGNDQLAFSTKVGVRKVEIKNSLLFVNGKRVFLKGANRHDTDPLRGRAVTTASMERDVLMFKQNNLNTIRTSHYPNDVVMYSMFDYYGLYVCCEADIEDHANQSISDMPSWIPAFKDRVIRMVGTYKNYPSIIFWSLGNESGGGRNFKYCYEVAHQMDDTRPVHYEGAHNGKSYGGLAYSDFYSKMYPSMDWMYQNTSNLDKPMFLCEYAHAMGNAIGNLDHYVRVMENSNSTIGGCIWDWVDQAIYEPLEIKKGIYRLHTGYDFPGPHQGNFCSNGIVTADRRYTSKLAEVKGAYQYISFSRLADSENKLRLSIKNNYTFRSLKGLDIKYEYLVEGNSLSTNVRPLPDVKAGDSVIVEVPIPVVKSRQWKEVLLNVTVSYHDAQTYAPAGHVVAQSQFTIKDFRPFQKPMGRNMALNVENNDDVLRINNAKVSVEFNKQTGIMQSLKFNQRELLYNQGGFLFNNHRWIENDRFQDTATGLELEGTITTEPKGSACKVRTSRKGTKADQQIVYTVNPDGSIDMEVTITPHSDNLRRAGVACRLDSALQNVSYYALGPWENYCDRKDGVTLGRYKSSVDSLMEHYIKPQTTGDRGHLRELALTDNEGNGLLIEADGNVSFSACRYTDEDLMNAPHEWELKKQPFVYLHLDGAQRGIGNASCGPPTLKEYWIKQEPVIFRLRLSGLSNNR